MSPHRLLVVLALVMGVARTARADRLIVYGPPGTGTERRALAIVQTDAGACAQWDGVEATADEPGVQVNLENTEGGCARWMRITAEPPRPMVTVHLRGPALADAAAAVAMGSDLGLGVHATRSGRALYVRISGAPEGDPVEVTAVWQEGQVTLDARTPSTFSGTVPATALVGIVARSGSLVGADALAGVDDEPSARVLVLASSFAIPAGAAVRTAAFIVATDRRGRLSRDVPLRIESERGRLRALTWLKPGLASVVLAASPDLPSVDLSVWTTSRAAARSVEIPVEAAWPVRASIEAPATVQRGQPLVVTVAATALGGPAVDAARVEVHCGEGVEAVAARDASSARSSRFECTPGVSGPMTIVAGAQVDGRFLPLALRAVTVTDPPPPPPLAITVAPEPAPRASAGGVRSSVSPAAALLLGIDASGRLAWGGGIRADLDVGPRFVLSTTARYTSAPMEAAAVGSVIDPLSGTRHGVEILAGAGVRLFPGRVSLLATAAAGPSWAYSDAQIGDTETESTAFRLVAQASVGPRARVAGMSFGLDVGVRLVPLSSESTWREPVATGFLEVSGGL